VGKHRIYLARHFVVLVSHDTDYAVCSGLLIEIASRSYYSQSKVKKRCVILVNELYILYICMHM